MELDPIEVRELTDEEVDKIIDDIIVIDENEFKVDHITEDGVENHFKYKTYEKDVIWDDVESVYALVEDIFKNEEFEKKEKLCILGNVLTYNKNCFVKAIKKKARKVRKGYTALENQIKMQKKQMEEIKARKTALHKEVQDKNREIKTLSKENNWFRCNKNKIADRSFDPKFMPQSLKDEYDKGLLFNNSQTVGKPTTSSGSSNAYFDKSSSNGVPQKKKVVIVRKKTV